MIIIPANLETLKTLKDGTISLVFETNELNPKDVGILYSMRNQFGFLAFKKELFTDDQKELLLSLSVDEFDKGKSPSKRMRNVLYRLWEQDNKGYDDPNLYYQYRMNHLIEMLKNEFEK